jgi:uncharacterized phiE125 gp8 family phage protein
MMRVLQTIGPEPIDTATARMHLRVDDTYEDALIAEYIAAARAHCERFTGLSFVAQRIAHHVDFGQDGDILYMPKSIPRRVTLPISPAVSVQSVTDDDGNTITATWTATACPTVVTVADAQKGLTIEYTTGAQMLTPDVKTAMLMLVHQMYQSRGAVDDEAVQRVEEAYLRPHRVLFGAA